MSCVALFASRICLKLVVVLDFHEECMEDNRDVVVEVDLRPHDVYTPFRWDRGNLARWITAIVLCWIFYDLYRDSRATVLCSPGGESIVVIMALLVLFILLALLAVPYPRVRAMFRKSPAATRKRPYTFGPSGYGSI